MWGSAIRELSLGFGKGSAGFGNFGSEGIRDIMAVPQKRNDPSVLRGVFIG